MKNSIITLIALTFLISFSSCKETLVGPEEINDPENNFELLWNDLNNHYGLFQARGWDWDAVYSEFRPQVNANTTDDELWEVLSNMIETLDDSHTYIGIPNTEKQFVSGNASTEEAEKIFDRQVTVDNYLEDFMDLDETKDFSTGKVQNKDIGYIYLGGFGDSRLDMIDDVMVDMEKRAAIIIDLRNNSGGMNRHTDHIVGKFINDERWYASVKDKIGPGPNEFSDPVKKFSKPSTETPYLKPVVVLTDGASVSAAEDFLLQAKLFNHFTQIGDVTCGDLSDTSMTRFLPNGWIFGFSTREYRLPDGSLIDGIGHHPDVFVKNKIEDVENGIDEVMETAIQYLFDQYGIQ